MAKKSSNILACPCVQQDYEVIVHLDLAVVRPHLQYCVQFWTPHYKNNIEVLRCVQRRTGKLVKGLEHKS